MAKIPLKGVPWLVVIQAALAARERLGVLTPTERSDLARLLRTTRGRPSNDHVAEVADEDPQEVPRLHRGELGHRAEV